MSWAEVGWRPERVSLGCFASGFCSLGWVVRELIATRWLKGNWRIVAVGRENWGVTEVGVLIAF